MVQSHPKYDYTLVLLVFVDTCKNEDKFDLVLYNSDLNGNRQTEHRYMFNRELYN